MMMTAVQQQTHAMLREGASSESGVVRYMKVADASVTHMTYKDNANAYHCKRCEE